MLRIERVLEDLQQHVFERKVLILDLERRRLTLRRQPLRHRRQHARDGDVTVVRRCLTALTIVPFGIIANGETGTGPHGVAQEAVEEFEGNIARRSTESRGGRVVAGCCARA
jgi:hypothetical protein